MQRGGTVEAVLQGLVHLCIVEDIKMGERSFYDTFSDEIDKLVECRNDHEFGFVIGMLLDVPGNRPRSTVS